MPARAWGTIRMARPSVISTSAARTPSTISVATSYLLFSDQRGGAVDLHHVDARARLEHRVLVVRSGGPHLAAYLDAAAVGVNSLNDDRAGADERSRPGAKLRRRVQMAPGDRAQQRERGDRGHDEDEEL